ncbi:MAG: alpha-amylase family glycosyl hydrolase [Promethearchaeia archaeon]
MVYQAPRIYNLFPRLLGSVNHWYEHIERIKNMDFNWIYMNPLNFAGFSGSLYSIKDPFKFNPLFTPGEKAADPYSWEPLRDFIQHCHQHDLKFMLGLIINHMAIDSYLLTEHKRWFKKKWALLEKSTRLPVKFFEGEEMPDVDYSKDEYILEYTLANPYSIDPKDARKVTIYGDLAELNYEDPKVYNEIIDYWKGYFDFILDLGIDGFRCESAYQVPHKAWEDLISYAKYQNSTLLFLANTLGCTLKQCRDISDAGFDYILSSSKWWDFTESWLIEQYNEFRQYAPSVSFPESHDTKRVAMETEGDKDFQIFRYFFAAFFSAGVLMPLGYEYGFKKPIDVVEGKPEQWEEKSFDISNKIRQINEFKQKYLCLNEDGEITQFAYKDKKILLLRKSSRDSTQHFLLIYNKDRNNSHQVNVQNLTEILDLGTPIYQVFIPDKRQKLKCSSFEKKLTPNEYLLFFQDSS